MKAEFVVLKNFLDVVWLLLVVLWIAELKTPLLRLDRMFFEGV